MTYSYWYVFIVMLMPYIFAGLTRYNNPIREHHSPKDFLDSLDGWRKRSHWAQVNSFEIFPPFAAAVIIAHLAGASQQLIDVIALTFLMLRILYGVLYLANKTALKTLTWLASLVCIFSLFFIAI